MKKALLILGVVFFTAQLQAQKYSTIIARGDTIETTTDTAWVMTYDEQYGELKAIRVPNLPSGSSVITDLTATNWRVFYSNGSGSVSELALGTNGQYLKSNGASSIPSWDTPTGTGDVSKVGTPANNQIGVWTGDGTIEGNNDFTFDGAGVFSITESSGFPGIYLSADGGSNTSGMYASGNDATISAVDALTNTAVRHLYGTSTNTNTFFGIRNTVGSGRLYSLGIFTPASETTPVFSVDTTGAFTATGSMVMGSADVSEAEFEILDGATLTTTELNYVDGVTSGVQTQLDAKLNTADTVELSSVAWLLADTVVLGAFSAVDSFNTSFIYGSFYNNGSDTLVVTEMMACLQGTTPSLTVDIEWHATLGSGSATGLNTTPPTITSITTGDSDTTFDNAQIPPGVFVWLKTPTVTTAPTFMTVTLLGYRLNRTY